jgi:N-acetylmuramoyl-L-alanine amidase
VSEFQTKRGIPNHGVCDKITWMALVEAGYQLGDRVLYLKRPMFRGDDVSELQYRLGSLGFDPGNLDGIYGPKTAKALNEFQFNVGLPADGICGRTTVQELKRVYGRSSEHIRGVRERAYLRSRRLSLAEATVAVVSPHELEVSAEIISLRLRQNGAKSLNISSVDQSELAHLANELKADACIHLEFSTSAVQIAYYSGFSYTSPAGQSLAQLIAQELTAQLPSHPLTLRGMTLPILRETQMPTVSLQIQAPSLWVTQAPVIAESVQLALTQFFQDPRI